MTYSLVELCLPLLRLISYPEDGGNTFLDKQMNAQRHISESPTLCDFLFGHYRTKLKKKN
jgi:hypothetical protein